MFVLPTSLSINLPQNTRDMGRPALRQEDRAAAAERQKQKAKERRQRNSTIRATATSQPIPTAQPSVAPLPSSSNS